MPGFFYKIRAFVFILLSSSFLIAQEKSLNLDSFIDEKVKEQNITNVFCVYLKDIKSDKILYVYDKNNLGNSELSLGSIIKIFSIIAKFKNHPVDIAETHFCNGYDENTPYVVKCWLREGHKKISLIPAIANSCNTYFYYFVQDIDFNLFIETLKEWKILKGSENWGKKFISREEQIMAMIGKMNILKLKPIDIVESFAKIFMDKKRLQSEVRDVLFDGMRLCYQQGTASKVRKKLFLSTDFPVICKTGTGIFEENGKIDIKKTNGSFIGLLENRYLVFVFVENSTGAETPTEIGLSILREVNSMGKED